jgi:pimeloyl-ACP methyl ester carboxylesterase
LEGLTLHDFAADVAGVIKTLKRRRVHILGYAWGGRVVRCLAVDRPELVKSVIVLAAGGKAGPTPEATAVLQKMKPGLSKEEKKEAVRSLFFAPSADPAPFMALKVWEKTAGSQMKAMLSTPVDKWWSGGNAPMLVIQGLDDQLAPPANGRALRDDYGPRVKLVELANAGHALVLEQPGKISEVVREYIKKSF